MTSITEKPTRNWFTDKELQCGCRHCQTARKAGEPVGFNAGEMKLEFLLHLNRLREYWYCKPMPVSSGFRCLSHPIEAKKVTGAKAAGLGFVPGDHPCGLGVDIQLAGEDALELLEAAGAYNYAHARAGMGRPFTAISPNQRGTWGSRFVHLGANVDGIGRPRPTIWTY
ncbi:hypothetical protein [Microbulbifer sp. ALW1]|uniref:hypothetical protein n=1 Tax=Microbulbifer sp. (strain ALW1) TaxID=1516059 RepID=UPI0013576E80|nr:hypothetical protein [Microbulbifer sp. ALW1]